MPEIKVIRHTPKPISFIGEVAGICYNSDTEDPEKNYKRGLQNLRDDHGRTFEFPDIVMVLDGYSARVMRELYTHVIGTSKLQASTRYIDYSDKFDYYTPGAFQDEKVFHDFMEVVSETYDSLKKSGYKKEDIANILPLGMSTKVVLKINVRALLHMGEVRCCSRAYQEFQDLMKDIKSVLRELDSEWATIATMIRPKCDTCTERDNCEL